MTKTKRQNFSRFNQPVQCRSCDRMTTWSDSNGYHGLDLCKTCFDAASMENEHNDGYHADKPNNGCKQCMKALGQPEVQ